MNYKPYKHLPPFKGMVLQNFPFIEEDFDAITNYQLLCKVVEYLRNVIANELVMEENVTNLYNEFVNLKNYVDNYFANLDVQEEINNKLDEMVESGELETIIENFAFKNYDISNNYEIEYIKNHNDQFNIDYHLTRIKPKNINKIQLKGGLAFNSISEALTKSEPLLDIARRNKAVVITNASTYGDLTGKLIIRNKQVLNPNYTSAIMILAVDEDGQLNCFDNTYSADTLINDYKVVNTWGNSGPLILDGDIMYSEWTKVDSDIVENRHPRTCVIQEYDSNDIIFLNIEGRRSDSIGVNFSEWATFIQSILPNTRIAYAMGGGGDSQLIIKGNVLNDCNDLTLRNLKDSIFVDFNDENSEYSTLEEDLVNSRSTDLFLYDLLNNRLPYNKSYINNTKVINLEYVGNNNFIGNLDYNTDVKTNESIFVKFPSIEEITESGNTINFGAVAKINLHYSTFSTQNTTEVNGNYIYPKQLLNKIVLLNNINSRFRIDDNNIVSMLNTSTDLDTLKDNGKYYSNNFTNKPTNPRNNTTEAGWVIVGTHPQLEGYCYQLYIARPSGNVYYRVCENNEWKTWRASANYSEIMLKKPSNYTNNDLNSFKYNNSITVAYGNTMSNKPSGAGNGWVVYIPYPDDENYGMQLYIDRRTDSNTGRIYLRSLNNGTWSTWNKFPNTTEVQNMIDTAIANLNNQ